MIAPPQIVDVPGCLSAVIHIVVPRAEIAHVMDPAISEVLATLKAQGISPSGPLFSYHLRKPTDTFEFEVGFPVARPVQAVGRVKPSQLPPARAVHTVHYGAYEGLRESWGEFCGWIEKQDLDVVPGFWETYVAGPESSPDPATWRTELFVPLASPGTPPATPDAITAASIQPYLFFGGRCDEALAFYREALGAEIEFRMTYSQNPDGMPPGMLPPGFENKVMHASFRIGSSRMMASDGCEEGSQFGGFTLALNLPTEAEVDRVFEALAEGGQVRMPPARTFWSPRFGMVTDRFGIGWMVSVPGSDADLPPTG